MTGLAVDPANPRRKEIISNFHASLMLTNCRTISLVNVGIHAMRNIKVTSIKSFVNLRFDCKRATFVALLASALNHM